MSAVTMDAGSARSKGGRGKIWQFLSAHRRLIIDYSAWLLLAVLVIVGISTSSLFFTASNLYNIAQQCTIIGVLALGQFLVILTGGIDLSLGSALALTAMVAALAMPLGAPVAVLLALIAGLVVGAISGAISVYGGLPPFIVTFGMMALCRGIALTITGGERVAVHDSPLAVFGFGWQPVAVWAVAIAILAVVVNRTAFGTHIYAVGSNLEATRVAGINTKGVLIAVFAISGLCAGLAGLLSFA
ncbi:MAG: ABC transporter permease, partial [Propionibacteriaceae bacterium]|nr:ABC transporter permease [Propionibacteriaceae bacterium]